MIKRVALGIAGVLLAGGIGYALVLGNGLAGPQPVKCGYLSCAAGQVGQPCTMGGYPGMVVRNGPKALACDPSPGNMPTAAPVSPAAPPPPSSPAPVILNTTCDMGWLVPYYNGGFYPDTAAGMRQANQTASADGGSAVTGARVTVSNTTSGGVTLNGFTVEIDDSQGSPVGTPFTVTADTPGAQGTLPRYLGPGESVSFTLDWQDVTSPVHVTTQDYLSESCTVTGWQ